MKNIERHEHHNQTTHQNEINMLYLKIILAIIISSLPFIYHYYVRPKKDSSSKWRNIYTAIGSQFPRLRLFKAAVWKLFRRIYEGMKKSDNFRKFFTLITLIFMIVVQFVDFNASTTVAKMVQDNTDTTETMRIATIYAPLMSRPYATLLAAVLSMTLFNYTLANLILTRLHNSRKLFCFVAVTALIAMFPSPRYFVVTEMLEIALMAALIYPNKITETIPKGGKKIPVEEKQYRLPKAA